MIRECDICHQVYVELRGEVTRVCAPCKAGMPPLSRLVGGEERKDLPEGLYSKAGCDER